MKIKFKKKRPLKLSDLKPGEGFIVNNEVYYVIEASPNMTILVNDENLKDMYVVVSFSTNTVCFLQDCIVEKVTLEVTARMPLSYGHKTP